MIATKIADLALIPKLAKTLQNAMPARYQNRDYEENGLTFCLAPAEALYAPACVPTLPFSPNLYSELRAVKKAYQKDR